VCIAGGLLVLLGACGASALADAPGFQPAPGYQAAALDLQGTAFAISPGGRVAVAHDAADGTASIAVYDRVEPADRKLLQTIKAPAGTQFKYFGGIAFQGDDILLFSENGVTGTVFRALVGTGEAQALLPNGTLSGVADVAIRPSDGRLYALTTPG